MEELQKSIRVNKLLDIYGALLTKHQEEVLELYYQMDLSLSEISEQLGISRNGVYDAIKKATALLEKYEEKLNDMFRDGTLLIDLDGKKVGQINGLAVMGTGEYSFGKPSKITASTFSLHLEKASYSMISNTL